MLRLPLRRRPLVGLATALLVALPVAAASAGGPVQVTSSARLAAYRWACLYSNSFYPQAEDVSVCAWDAVADPATTSVAGGVHRRISVLYHWSTCSPGCTAGEGAVMVPAGDVAFDPGMTGVHLHTDAAGCRIDADSLGLAQAPSTPLGLLDPPVVHGPTRYPDGSWHAAATQFSDSGLDQYYKDSDIRVCGHGGFAANGFRSLGYGAIGVVTEVSADASVPAGFRGVCLDATTLWYWHAAHRRQCLPWS